MSDMKEISLGTMTFKGRPYEVFRVDGGDGNIAYRLKGPRGADYSLLRNVNKRHMMFATNNISFVKKTAFEGMWFSDQNRDGTPCPLRIL